MPGTLLRGLADPLDADVHWGVPDDEQHRCADVIWAPDKELPDVDFAALSPASP